MEGKALADWEACKGCGVCVGQCPNGAMSLARGERKGEPLDVWALAKEAPMQRDLTVYRSAGGVAAQRLN